MILFSYYLFSHHMIEKKLAATAACIMLYSSDSEGRSLYLVVFIRLSVNINAAAKINPMNKNGVFKSVEGSFFIYILVNSELR